MANKIELLRKAEQECKTALRTVPGQHILRLLIIMGGVYSVFSKQDIEALPVGESEALAYLEGRRSIVLQLMQLSGYTQMGMVENTSAATETPDSHKKSFWKR